MCQLACSQWASWYQTAPDFVIFAENKYSWGQVLQAYTGVLLHINASEI